MRGSVLFALVLLILTGCTTYRSDVSTAVEEPLKSEEATLALPAEEEAAEAVSPVHKRPFEEAGIGFTGPHEEEYRSFYSWDEMEAYISPEDLFVPVDFSRDMVLACFMGEKPTGGYMNQITRMEESSDLLTVYVEISKPKEGDLVAQMLTYPWSAVITEITDKKIEWNEIRADR